MEKECVFVDIKWILWLCEVMYNEKHNTGHVRGLTVEQYQFLKPKVERLSANDCGKEFRYKDGVWHPVDDNMDEIVFKIKEWFKELEAHPALLAKNKEDITFYMDQIWNGASFMCKEFKRDKNGKKHYTGVEPTWV